MTKVCRHCGEEFDSLPGKPGFVDECLSCVTEDVEPLRAVVECPKRGAPEITIGEASKIEKMRKLGYLEKHRIRSKQEILAEKVRKAGGR